MTHVAFFTPKTSTGKRVVVYLSVKSMDKLYKNSETGCCPRFDPAPWDEKEITWKGKLFLQDHITSFLHIPLNFGQVMIKNMDLIEKSKASPRIPLMLVDEKSLWGSDIFIAVGKKVPGAKMTRISGTFLTKVFEGSFREMGTWIRQMNEYLTSKGKQCQKMYFSYTTCPKCAKFYGKNYVVIFAKI